jgi:hypothetical protein
VSQASEPMGQPLCTVSYCQNIGFYGHAGHATLAYFLYIGMDVGGSVRELH